MRRHSFRDGILEPVAGIVIPARSTPFDASDFFRDRQGLYVRRYFQELFQINDWPVVETAPRRIYETSLMKEEMYSRDVMRKVQERSPSTFEDIAWLIQDQWSGGAGFLETNRHLNMFFVARRDEILIVGVGRCPTKDNEWGIRGWDEHGLDFIQQGHRIVYPITTT